MDVGTSGGVAGLERGYCLMIDGVQPVLQRLQPVFTTRAPGKGTAAPTPGWRAGVGTADRGWLHCGPHGAGHFVKMVHNGIEYGLMAAYAEGLNIPHHANAGLQAHAVDAETASLREPAHYQYQMDLPETDTFRVPEAAVVDLGLWATNVKPICKSKKAYRKLLENQVDALSDQQRLLCASNRHALLLVFQAMDTAGKDGAIRHVMSGVNPQGCQVFSFQHPSVGASASSTARTAKRC